MSEIDGSFNTEGLDPRLSMPGYQLPDLDSMHRNTSVDGGKLVPDPATSRTYLQAAGGELVPVVEDDDMGVLVTIDRRVLEKQSFPELEGLGRREGCL